MNFLKKMDKKAQMMNATNSLSNFAITIFIMVVVVFAAMTGATTIRDTIPADSTTNNNTRSNMSAMLESLGLFAEYSDLIVIVGILAVVILLVVSAFNVRR